jgi:hypothetical protein
MWKQITAAILLMAFSVNSFCSAFIVFDYYSRTASYSKNCVNKARPTLHCNGKCQMMKRLQQQEKGNRDNSEKKVENKIVVISSRTFFSQLVLFQSNLNYCYAACFQSKPIDRSYPLLHPPSCA